MKNLSLFCSKRTGFTCAWSVMYRPTFSQSLMLQCLMVGQAPWPLTQTAEPTAGTPKRTHTRECTCTCTHTHTHFGKGLTPACHRGTWPKHSLAHPKICPDQMLKWHDMLDINETDLSFMQKFCITQTDYRKEFSLGLTTMAQQWFTVVFF